MNGYSPAALDTIRQAIADSGGNEVFFLGHCDNNRRIWSVTVLARGNQHCVAAVTGQCRCGDTVIHNHPSGELTPSDADVAVAAQLGNNGIGFHIIDNDASRVYRVVEADSGNATVLDCAEISALLDNSSPLAQQMEAYEERPQQVRMAFAVATAFNHNRIAVIEAGTGTGKGLAYLIPAALWAVRNEDKVVISTNTINLQEQLLHHDIPLLQQATGTDFRAVLVKGRTNYLCLRRLEQCHQQPDLFTSDYSGEIASLRHWADNSSAGSRDELTQPPANEVWNEVCCEVDQCPRGRCQHYQRCFFHKARRQAASADLLIVNHALLFADLAVRMETDNYLAAAVLPAYTRVIIDEAHHLEDAATSSFSGQISRFSFSRILNRLSQPRNPAQGQLPRLLSTIADKLPDGATTTYETLYNSIENCARLCQQLRTSAHEHLQQALETVAEKTPPPAQWHITSAADPSWQQLTRVLTPLPPLCIELAKEINATIARCEQLLPPLLAEQIGAQLTDLQGLGARLATLGSDINFFLSLDGDSCTWTETSHNKRFGAILWLRFAPIEVASTLKQALYDRMRTVILTSATLTTGNSFRYFFQRAGLELCTAAHVEQLQLESPFDFGAQSMVAIPNDIVEPNHPDFTAMLAGQIEAAVRAAGGRTFVLFTAYSTLRAIYNQLEPILQAAGIRCLRQGQAARHHILSEFRRSDNCVLFGTDSFWEGVDVPGRALEQIIITRLPFRVPTEPIQIARSDALKRRGSDPFYHFTVPQAIIRLKQGFGRLIRHRNDCGVVVILDRRVISKGYGKLFLRSLPPATQAIAPAAQIQQQLSDFFQRRHT